MKKNLTMHLTDGERAALFRLRNLKALTGEKGEERIYGVPEGIYFNLRKAVRSDERAVANAMIRTYSGTMQLLNDIYDSPNAAKLGVTMLCRIANVIRREREPQ